MIRKSLLVSKPTDIYFDNSKWNLSRYAQNCQSLIQKWRQNAKTRKQLANMPLYLLRDIGLTEPQVRSEVQKKFWQ